jgi:SAM-dependent methyltransferase
LIANVPDPFRFTTIAHASHTWLGPVSDTTVDRLLERIPRSPEHRALDVGCGKGELLVRALEKLGGTGTGVEPNPAFAAEARERAARRLPPNTARIVEAKLADAALPDHSFSLGICTGSIHAFGDWPAALDGMAKLVSPDGWALLAPGYWKRPPDRAYLSALGGSEDQQHSLLATTAIARKHGWQAVVCLESTLAEWDAYEHAYAANVRAWCRANPADPEAAGFSARIEKWAAAYRAWGRDTMGYALMLLRLER